MPNLYEIWHSEQIEHANYEYNDEHFYSLRTRFYKVIYIIDIYTFNAFQ